MTGDALPSHAEAVSGKRHNSWENVSCLEQAPCVCSVRRASDFENEKRLRDLATAVGRGGATG